MRRISDDDAWTLRYLDLMHLQPIIEALDDDASGYVTIQEVNQFTTLRPMGWRYDQFVYKLVVYLTSITACCIGLHIGLSVY